MTRDYRVYKEYPHFDMRCGCGCDPCNNHCHSPNFPNFPDFCQQPCPPQCSPHRSKCKPINSCDDLMWLMIGIGIGQRLDK